MKKQAVFGIALLALIALLVAATQQVSVASDPPIPAVREGRVRVSIGTTHAYPPGLRHRYRADRHAVLADLVRRDPDRTIQAVVVFDKFATADETMRFVEGSGLAPQQVYLAIGGQTGRGGMGWPPDQNLEEAIQVFIGRLGGLGTGGSNARRVFGEVATGLEGEQSPVIGLRVTGRVADLQVATAHPLVAFVDVFYHPQAEQTAAEHNVPVKYIVVGPDRPDDEP